MWEARGKPPGPLLIEKSLQNEITLSNPWKVIFDVSRNLEVHPKGWKGLISLACSLGQLLRGNPVCISPSDKLCNSFKVRYHPSSLHCRINVFLFQVTNWHNLIVGNDTSFTFTLNHSTIFTQDLSGQITQRVIPTSSITCEMPSLQSNNKEQLFARTAYLFPRSALNTAQLRSGRLQRWFLSNLDHLNHTHLTFSLNIESHRGHAKTKLQSCVHSSIQQMQNCSRFDINACINSIESSCPPSISKDRA